jgi:hypothetical protein
MDFHHVPSCGGYAMLIDALTRLYAFEWLDIWRRNQFRSTAQPIMAISPSHGVAHHLCHQNVGKLPICHLGRWSSGISSTDLVRRFSH